MQNSGTAWGRARTETAPRAGGEKGDRVVVLGAGPAGLTAAWELSRNGVEADVLEADPTYVGGIARTATYKGYRFDIGGHRFFTKSDEVRKVWHDILEPADWLLDVPRMSRIYYGGKFYSYPLRAGEALRNLGVINSLLCVLSYLKAKALPRRPERSFEDWVVNHFGQRLYRIFFKTYTEKVWGMPCTEISADWAAQRIKGLSLVEAIRNALPRAGGRSKDGEVIKTLIDRFDYPRHGPGMMWETATGKIRAAGNAVHLDHRVAEIRHAGGQVTAVRVDTPLGRVAFEGTAFISTLPLRSLVRMVQPAAPPEVRRAAEALRYRDFLTVVLVVDRPDVFPDNWIYVHDPAVHLGRVQNFRNWSPHMVPDQAHTALGLEYFCDVGDELWNMDDADLVELGKREIASIGLVDADRVFDGTVVRMPKAYPVYDDDYKHNVGVIRTWAAEHLSNMQLVGRNGMHKYNNQDHSMLAALLAARNLLGEDWDPWRVNTDAEYHEEVAGDADAAGRMTPRRLVS
jgi:protoporphyrinogen oxidase